MVDTRALRLAVLVAGSALLLFLTGLVLFWTVRLLRYATLALVIVLLAYAVYELYAGWSAVAGENSRETAVDEGTGSIEAVRDEYASGTLSDEEFEAELDELLGPEDDRESELEYE